MMSANADDRFARSEGVGSATAVPPTSSSESIPAETDRDGSRSRPSSGGCDGSDQGGAAKSNVEELSSMKLSESSGTTKNGAGAGVRSLPDCPEVVPISEPDFHSSPSPATARPSTSGPKLSIPDQPEVVPVSEPDFHSPSFGTARPSVFAPMPGGSGDGDIEGLAPPSTDVGHEIAIDEASAVASEEVRARRAAENDRVAAAVPGFLAEEAQAGGGAGRRSEGEDPVAVARERMLRDAPLVYGEIEEDAAAASEEKSWLRKHRRSLAAAALGLTLAAILAAVLATQLPSGSSHGLPASQDNESTTTTSVPPPTPSTPPPICSTERCRSIRSVLEPLVANSSSLEDASSPQARALLWLADEDVRRVENTSDVFNLTQRFAVAAVYFATGGGEGTWREDANFLSGEHVCEWHAWPEEKISSYDEIAEKGVGCYGTNAVLALYLPNNNLTGSIPEEISLLPSLGILMMVDNNIGGTIPAALSSLGNLLQLNLGVNQIEGTIPNMSSSLLNLDMYDNKIGGTIPAALSVLDNIMNLNLGFNRIEGTIPNMSSSLMLLDLGNNALTGPVPTLTNFTNLTALGLYNNYLTSTLPSFSNIPDLKYLHLASNLISGTLPSQLSNLNRTLKGFGVQGNLLNGTIPTSIVELTNLKFFVLSNNNFDGGIPEDIGNLDKVFLLSLWDNNLTGTIPSSMGNMTGMKTLWLSMNALTGTVPKSIAQLTNLNFMSIDRNALTGNIDFLCDLGMKLIESDCLEGPENSSLIECSCCGRCCNAAASICDPAYSSSGL